ncbi:sigma-70 family RNA polymerase sigma factor [Corallococcus sp. M34]|uniref:RNA polymerase sigma factor n=1 Tax=Citreicoccus inhibens TaxID=2849499 RepID=UPI001C22E16A|nr:sigma-70 family RNA polymerase sigma factor [Citreicoccus inhibens]MBU8898839.1 sigma-70 family RNA polymerase sigma factor [Citreicoccus inhibens]
MTFAAWAVLTVGVLLLRAGVKVSQWSWRLARASLGGTGLLLLLACIAPDSWLEAMFPAESRRFWSQPGVSARLADANSYSWEAGREALLATRRQDSTPQVVGVADFKSESSALGSDASDCLEQRIQQADLMEKARRVASRFVQSHDVEDVVHTTLISTCLRVPPPWDFEQYFLRSIEFSARDEFRQRSRACCLEERSEPVCPVRQDEQLISAEALCALTWASCQLPVKEWELLRMRYYEERTDVEIARQLHITPVAVRKRLQRARANLRAKFPEECQ